jgi:cell division septation protein DedD
MKVDDPSVVLSAIEKSSALFPSPMSSDLQIWIGDDKETTEAEKLSAAAPSPVQSSQLPVSESVPSLSAAKESVSKEEAPAANEKARQEAEQVLSSEPDAVRSSGAPASVPPSGTDLAVINENAPAKIQPSDASEAATENSNVVTTPTAELMTHSVQVGAFRPVELAKKLVARLTAKGYTAGMVPVTDRRGRKRYTARIADNPSREAAQRQADSFTAQEEEPTAVRPYNAF